MQIPEEFSEFLCYLKDFFVNKSLNFLEIGTATNLTNTMLWDNLQIKNNVILDNLECPNVEKSLFGNLKFKSGTIFIIGNSNDVDIINKTTNLNIKYDLIFCDGNHEYEYVKSD